MSKRHCKTISNGKAFHGHSITLREMIKAGEDAYGKGSYNQSWGIVNFENMSESEKGTVLWDFMVDKIKSDQLSGKDKENQALVENITGNGHWTGKLTTLR